MASRCVDAVRRRGGGGGEDWTCGARCDDVGMHVIVIPKRTVVAGVRVYIAVCLSVCFFPHDTSETDAVRITEIDVQRCS